MPAPLAAMVPHKQRRSPKRSSQDVKAKHRKTHSKCSQETGGGDNDDDFKRKKVEKKEGVVAVVVVRGNNFVKRNTGGQEDRL